MSIRALLVAALMAIPWLNPFASGPSPSVQPLLTTMLCVGLLLLLYRPVDKPNIACVWVAAGVLSSAMALCQYLGWSHYFSPWMNQTVLGEAFANLRQRNQFATLTNIAQAALLFGTVARQRPPSPWVLAGAALLAMGTVASSSRTGLMQLLLLAVLVWCWQRHDAQARVHRVLGAAALGYVCASFLLPLLAGLSGQGIWARFAPEALACESRLILWANVLELIVQKPWLGWGWGELDYAHYITPYAQPRFCAILDNAHNLPLHLAVELGLPAAMLICSALAYGVWRARPWRELDATRQMAWAVLALIGLHSLLEYPLWYGPFQLAVGLCGVLLWPGAIQGANSKSYWPIALYVRSYAAIFLIVLTGWLVLDYQRVSQLYLPGHERQAWYQTGPLRALRESGFFTSQAEFARLSLTPLLPANAAQVHALALQLLHYAPEPVVIEKVIASAQMLGLVEEAQLHQARYQAAFPRDYAKWYAAY